MNTRIVYNVTVDISFADDEFKCLWQHAEHHYDYKVKSMTEQHGKLYGHRNARNWQDDTQGQREAVAREYSSREIQLLTKSLELPWYEKDLAVSLYHRLYKLLPAIDEAYNGANIEPSTYTTTPENKPLKSLIQPYFDYLDLLRSHKPKSKRISEADLLMFLRFEDREKTFVAQIMQVNEMENRLGLEKLKPGDRGITKGVISIDLFKKKMAMGEWIELPKS